MDVCGEALVWSPKLCSLTSHTWPVISVELLETKYTTKAVVILPISRIIMISIHINTTTHFILHTNIPTIKEKNLGSMNLMDMRTC